MVPRRIRPRPRRLAHLPRRPPHRPRPHQPPPLNSPAPRPDTSTYLTASLAAAPTRYPAQATVPSDAETVRARRTGAFPSRVRPLGDHTGTVDHRKILWTGSHNYTFNSLRYSDEAFVKLADSSVYDAYEAFFKSALPNATCTWVQGAWTPSSCS